MQPKKCINWFKITQLIFIVLTLLKKKIWSLLPEVFFFPLYTYVLDCIPYSCSPVEEIIIMNILFIDLVTTNQPRALVM